MNTKICDVVIKGKSFYFVRPVGKLLFERFLLSLVENSDQDGKKVADKEEESVQKNRNNLQISCPKE